MNKRANIISVTALMTCLLYGCANNVNHAANNKTYINKTVASKIDQAQKYYKNKDFKKSINILKTLAEQGNANAQYSLGYMYYYGQGVKSNKKIAAHWIKQSSSQGYYNAIKASKVMKFNSPSTQMAAKTPSANTPKEQTLAKKHQQALQEIKNLRKKLASAANKTNNEQNVKVTHKNLTETTLTPKKNESPATHKVMSSQDKKTIKKQLEKAQEYYTKNNYKQTFKILKPLAEQNNAEAQYSLGYLYLYGEGVAENREKALFWINKSAQQKFANAIRALKTLNHQPQKIATTVTTKHSSHYGPIKNNDTLWSIAKKTRPNTNISIHNMMQALYKKNPTAFNNNKLNSLKLGSILSVPNQSFINELINNKTPKQDNT